MLNQKGCATVATYNPKMQGLNHAIANKRERNAIELIFLNFSAMMMVWAKAVLS